MLSDTALVANAARVLVSIALTLAACGAPSTSLSGSVGLTPTPPSTAEAAICDPNATPLLLGPNGAQLNLGYGAGGTSTWVSESGMKYYLRESGDCIWIIGYLPPGPGQAAPLLTAFHGRLTTDFRIVGTFSDLTGVLVRGYDKGPFAYRVTFDGDAVVLVEDRAAGGPPACSGGAGNCPPPRELRRVAA